MAEDDSTHKPTDDLVKTIIDELLERARVEAQVVAFDQAVVNFWHNQYRAKFFYAIHVRGRSWEDAKDALRRKADELGAAAKRLADGRPITPREAALASFEVDCVPRHPQEPGTLWDWCN